jgi:hypothetical protein
MFEMPRDVLVVMLHLSVNPYVWAYNRYMGGVDRHDQLRMNHSMGKCGKKWWKYLFWFLLNYAIVNSYIIYSKATTRQTRKRRFRHVDFRLELVNGLIGGYAKRKQSVGGDQLSCNRVLVSNENIDHHTNVRLEGRRTTCKYHMRIHNKRRETVYGCAICNIHLCKDGCYAAYHQQENM